MYLQFWFYVDLCKTNVFLSSSAYGDGNSFADKLKNLHMRKNQQKLKNQHACNRPLIKLFSRYKDVIWLRFSNWKKTYLEVFT